MRHLSLLARIITPAAMVVFLSHELSRSLDVRDWWYAALLVGSVLTAVGIEIVGILAGHALEGFWRLGDMWRSLLSFSLLLIYSVTAVAILRGNPVLVFVPIVAAIVYILAALTDGLETAVSQQQDETAAQLNYDIERQRADDQHRRDMESKQQDIAAQNTLQIQLAHEQAQANIAIAAEKTKASVANARARAVKARAKAAESNESAQAKAKEMPKAAELSGNALLVFEALQRKPESTNVEIAESLPISPQRVGQIKKQLNGMVSKKEL